MGNYISCCVSVVPCLQSCQSIFESPESVVSSDVNIHLHTSFDFVTKGISDFRIKMEHIVAAITDLTIAGKKKTLF